MIDEAIYSILTENAEVAAIVNTKVFPIIGVSEEALPLVVYSQASASDPLLTHSGPTALTKAVFQISCWCLTAADVKALAKAVYRALHGFSGTVGSERIFYIKCVNRVDAFEPQSGAFNVSLDMLIAYRETLADV